MQNTAKREDSEMSKMLSSVHARILKALILFPGQKLACSCTCSCVLLPAFWAVWEITSYSHCFLKLVSLCIEKQCSCLQLRFTLYVFNIRQCCTMVFFTTHMLMSILFADCAFCMQLFKPYYSQPSLNLWMSVDKYLPNSPLRFSVWWCLVVAAHRVVMVTGFRACM